MSVAVEEFNAELPNFFLSFLLVGFPIPLELLSISGTTYYVSSNTLMTVYSSKVWLLSGRQLMISACKQSPEGLLLFSAVPPLPLIHDKVA